MRVLATLDKLALFNEASSEGDVVVMVADDVDDDDDGVMVTCLFPTRKKIRYWLGEVRYNHTHLCHRNSLEL